MIDKVRSLAKEWLENGKVDAILGLRGKNGCVSPHLFTDASETEGIVISSHASKIIPRYFPSSRSQRYKKNVLYLLEQKYPDAKIGIIARGCDERTLIELAKRDQLDLEKIEVMGVACTEEDAMDCRCPRPYPTKLDVGERVEGVFNDKAVNEFLEKSLLERLSFWKHELSKCMKCYGCRNACPLCFCEECELEQGLWVKTAQLPPEIPMFHLIRWYHIVDRCIECGKCEDACPVDIPLLTISKLLRRDIKELFNYEAGLDAKQEAPLLTTLDENPLKE